MKTITEMQLLIKDAYAKLDELSQNLSEYNHSDKDVSIDFDKLLSLGKRYPVIGHKLSSTDESVKKHYITLLISLVNIATENQENGWLTIQRIACGTNLKAGIEDLAVDAANLSEKQLDEFTDLLLNYHLNEIFILDCMLIYASCSTKNKSMIEYIAALSELLKCSNIRIKELSLLAKIIAEQDEKAFTDFVLFKKNINVCDFKAYTGFWSDGALMNSKNPLFIFGDSNNVIQKLEISDNKREIFIFNVEFKGSRLNFSEFNYIAFVECIFSDINEVDSYGFSYMFYNNAIKFSKCGAVVFNGCEFINLTSKGSVIGFSEQNRVEIKDCRFKKITAPKNNGRKFHGPSGIHQPTCASLNFGAAKSVKMSNSVFADMDGDEALYLSEVENIQVTNCTATNCAPVKNITGLTVKDSKTVDHSERNWKNTFFDGGRV